MHQRTYLCTGFSICQLAFYLFSLKQCDNNEMWIISTKISPLPWLLCLAIGNLLLFFTTLWRSKILPLPWPLSRLQLQRPSLSEAALAVARLFWSAISVKKIYHSILTADDFFLVDTIDKDSDDDDERVWGGQQLKVQLTSRLSQL